MKMFIEKFGKEVEIDEDHPLAIAQRQKNARAHSERIDGEPDVVGEDGMIHGDPLNLTDEQRAALRPLEILAELRASLSSEAGANAPTEKPALPDNLEELSKAELAEFANARFGLALEKSEMNKVSMLEAIRSAHSAEAAS